MSYLSITFLRSWAIAGLWADAKLLKTYKPIFYIKIDSNCSAKTLTSLFLLQRALMIPLGYSFVSALSKNYLSSRISFITSILESFSESKYGANSVK